MNKHYNLWQRLMGKPEEDRQREKLERLHQKLVEFIGQDEAVTRGLTTSEMQEMLDLLPTHI